MSLVPIVAVALALAIMGAAVAACARAYFEWRQWPRRLWQQQQHSQASSSRPVTPSAIRDSCVRTRTPQRTALCVVVPTVGDDTASVHIAVSEWRDVDDDDQAARRASDTAMTTTKSPDVRAIARRTNAPGEVSFRVRCSGCGRVFAPKNMVKHFFCEFDEDERRAILVLAGELARRGQWTPQVGER